MGTEAVLLALANLPLIDGICGYAFFVDELLDLKTILLIHGSIEDTATRLTRSRTSFALSLTKGRAMIGILSLAFGCDLLAEYDSMLYGTDMFAIRFRNYFYKFKDR